MGVVVESYQVRECGRRLALRALGVALVPLALIAALVVVPAFPANATTADVNSGGPLSRSTVLERAMSWVYAQVPYSQTSYYPSGGTGPNHGYRQDCSGFLSMAWDLNSSVLTTDLTGTSSPYTTQLSSWKSLQPGDLLGISTHVVLFIGWSANDAGRDRYFDMASESTSGEPAQVQTDQDALGYWQSYLPYQYKRIVIDAPAVASWSASRVDQFRVGPDGHLLNRFTTDDSASPVSWTLWRDLTALVSGPVMRFAPAATSYGPEQLYVFGIGDNGTLVQYSYHGLAWSATTVGHGEQGELAALTTTQGRVDLYGRVPGSFDSGGNLVQRHYVPGIGWDAWGPVAGSPAVIGDPAATRPNNTQVDLVAQATNGALLLGTVAAGQPWSFSQLAPTAAPLRPAIASRGPGYADVVIDNGTGQLLVDSRTPAGWGGFAPVPTAPSVSSAAALDAPGGLPTGSGSNQLYAFTTAAAGKVTEVSRTDGIWSYLGTS